MKNVMIWSPRDGLTPRDRAVRTLLGALQLGLFAAALFLLVPTPASDLRHPYETPVGASIALFGLSRLAASFNGRGGVVYNACEVLAFSAFAFVLPVAIGMK